MVKKQDISAFPTTLRDREKRPGVWPGRVDAVIILKLHTGSCACLSQIDLFPGTCCLETMEIMSSVTRKGMTFREKDHRV